MRRSRHEQWARASGLTAPLVRHEPWECLCPDGEPMGGPTDKHALLPSLRDPHEPLNPWPQVVLKTNLGFVVRCGGCGMRRPD